jgi:hypothetical protein
MNSNVPKLNRIQRNDYIRRLQATILNQPYVRAHKYDKTVEDVPTSVDYTPAERIAAAKRLMELGTADQIYTCFMEQIDVRNPHRNEEVDTFINDALAEMYRAGTSSGDDE